MKRTISEINLAIALGVVGAVVLLSQWSGNRALRFEAAALREETRELEKLREENRRLMALQVSTPELERLRADHAALPRLRAEIEAVRRTAVTTGR